MNAQQYNDATWKAGQDAWAFAAEARELCDIGILGKVVGQMSANQARKEELAAMAARLEACGWAKLAAVELSKNQLGWYKTENAVIHPQQPQETRPASAESK